MRWKALPVGRILVAVGLLGLGAAAAEKEVFVQEGEPVAVIGSAADDMYTDGNALVVPGGLDRDFGDAPPWKIKGLAGMGWGNTVEGDLAMNKGSFRIHARLTLPKIGGTGASIIMGGGYHTPFAVPEGRHAVRIWLDGADGMMYVRDYPIQKKMFGPFPTRPYNRDVITDKYPKIRTQGRRAVAKVRDYITAGRPFQLELERQAMSDRRADQKEAVFILRIDGKQVFRSTLEFKRWPANFGFLADRSAIRLHEFWAEGSFVRPNVRHTDLWMLGSEGYNSYRMPGLCVTEKGTVLAFVTARRPGASSGGERDLVMKRSADCGETWSETRMIWDTGDERFYVRDPTPLVDRETSEVFLLAGSNVARPGTDEPPADRLGVFIMRSNDDGNSWTDPCPLEGINDQTNHLTAGGSHGVQLRHAPYTGRLLIPCFSKARTGGRYHSPVVYSDDHGETWKLGGSVATQSSADEPTVVELEAGSVLMTGRGGGVYVSQDGGESFESANWNWPLRNSNPSLVRYGWPEDDQRHGKDRILWCDVQQPYPIRRKMTVKMSGDRCRSWPVSRVIYPGGAGYSGMTVLPDGRIGVLYGKDDYRRTSFASISLDWLTGK